MSVSAKRFRQPGSGAFSYPLRAVCIASALGATPWAHAQLDQSAISSSAPPSISNAAIDRVQQGEDAAPRRVLSIVPRVDVDMTWSDNIRLQSGTQKRSDFVTTLSPGIRFFADGDRLKADIDYSLSRLVHARDGSLDRNQNSLRAAGSYELSENFAFVDFSGNISQQTISAFGPRSGSSTSFNSNTTETATYSISPYVRGVFGDWANYQARYSRTSSRAKSFSSSDYDMDNYSVVLNGISQQRAVNWSLDASRQNLDYDAGRSFEADRIRGFLIYPFSPQLNVSLIPGWESNNYTSQDKQSGTTIGGQVQWAVSDRTNLSALLEKRFFGRAYSVSFDHRTPRTAWRFSDSRDVSVSPSQSATVSLGPLYDLLFFQFASIQPDPALRAQLVQSFLVANGLNGNTNVDLGFMSSAVSLARRQDISLTLIGQRDTLTFLLSQSENSRLLQVNASNDLGNSQFVRQHGFSIAYSHRLTPTSSMNVLASQTKSTGQFASAQSSRLNSLNVSMSTQLGKSVTGTLGFRRAISDNTLSSYTESAVRGGISVQF